MSLICPACERDSVTESTCPNCGTDLSAYHMLASLPQHQPILVKDKKRYFALLLPIAILFLLLGLGMGLASRSIVAKQDLSNTQAHTSITNAVPQTKSSPLISPTIKEEEPKEALTSFLSACGGFNYVVRSGDSLSAIASLFYGKPDFWRIGEANLQLQGRESFLEVGERIFIPNLEDSCQ